MRGLQGGDIHFSEVGQCEHLTISTLAPVTFIGGDHDSARAPVVGHCDRLRQGDILLAAHVALKRAGSDFDHGIKRTCDCTASCINTSDCKYGNKRTALVAACAFMLENGHDLTAGDADCVTVMRAVARGAMPEPALADVSAPPSAPSFRPRSPDEIRVARSPLARLQHAPQKNACTARQPCVIVNLSNVERQ